MKCRYVKTIYQNNDNGYCVFVYHTDDPDVPDAAKSKWYKGKGAQFTAVGSNLPESNAIEVDFRGKWEKSKYGLQLHVDNYDEFLPQTAEGITAYLSSGMVKGIGPKTAELIVKRFGTRTFDILDNYPDNLLEIKGITKKKLDVILLSYQSSHAMRDLAAYLTPFHITPKKIQKIYENYGSQALNIVKKQPYTLCRINGFGFLTVDEIARANKCRLNDPMRIEGCIHYCMEQEGQEGHLCQEKEFFQEKVYELLNHDSETEVVTETEISMEIYRLVGEKSLYYENGMLYPAKYYEYECSAARNLAELLMQESGISANIDQMIVEAQRELGILLSEKQAEAVKNAFAYMVSIITGGPGTGKTTVQRVILYIHNKLGGKSVLLTAPTGRASRRMAESTGRSDAVTMHSALGLSIDEDKETADKRILDMDLIIADEYTMADMRLSAIFFSCIKKGTRLVLVGDVDQLPSVGPGNVFRELVMCSVIPVTVLDMVFRQEKNSRIPSNALKMQENNASLDYGPDFMFIPAADAGETAEKVEEIYQIFSDKYAPDNVQVLTPFRKKGEASVDALNERLWEIVNPHEDDKPEIKAGRSIFRAGDRVIHNKNKNSISNGDVGYVREIFKDEDGTDIARLEFTDGRIVEYGSEDLDMVEHAYATTIHKSQGSEYQAVIIPWLPMFYKMLRRNILYTGVTRAKEQIAIIGSKKAIYIAIHNTECDKRNTQLGQRLVKEYNRLLEERKAS